LCGNIVRLKPELKGALLALLGVALVLVGVWAFVGIRLRIWTYREYERYVWLTANLPVAHLLWRGEMKAGDDVEELIKVWRPHVATKFDPWVELRWFPGGPSQDTISLIGIYVIAKNGRLVLASSYPDDGVLDRMFFNSLSPEEASVFRAALKAHVDKLRGERQDSAQPNGAANGSQPSRSDTNSTSSAAGSRR
jgi:hypothetical protein